MEKKATVRDIAKAAGVSVATVSYVLNDRKDTKISEATRKKVLQIANLMDYQIRQRPQTAEKIHVIGIVYHLRDDAPSRNVTTLMLVNHLVERFNRMRYNCMILSSEPDALASTPCVDADGIIAIDLEEGEFKEMSGSYYVPILCLDMLINDFLFYQIYTDMETIASRARELFSDDFCLVTERCCNVRYQNYLQSIVPKGRALILSDCSESELRTLHGQNVLALGAGLGLMLLSHVDPKRLAIVADTAISRYIIPDVRILPIDLEKKANLAVSIMLNALEKKFDVKHEYKV